jgi:RNA polymerase sigma-70 factor (ECF subfamily)
MAPDPELERSDGVRSSGLEPGERESAELLERIRRGDVEAFDAVARAQAPRLFRLAFRLEGRREDAEDLVQETLVRALPRLRGFEGRARLSTYLTRALVNLWKNRLRSRSRSRLVDWVRVRDDRDHDDRPTVVPVDGAPSALDRLVAEDRAETIRRAVTEIEPRRRLALLRREGDDRSYDEIAELTGVPIGTVRSRLARARADLRRLLEAEE